MNWFKHDCDASTDAKIKRLLIRYGAEGYAIYFHCLELIAGDISENNITFELEHDAEIIADNLKIKGTAETAGIDRVNEIMKYIISIGLFQESHGRIFCFKLLKRLDTSMTSNPLFRKMITEAKAHHDKIMINHDGVMQEEKRIEEKRSDKNIKHKHGEYNNVLLTDEEYNKLKDKLSNCEHWIKTLDEGIEMKRSKYQYSSHYLAILNWHKREVDKLPEPVKMKTCSACGRSLSGGRCVNQCCEKYEAIHV